MTRRDEPSRTVGPIVRQLTRGRSYVFVIMSYNARWDFYERIRRAISKEVSLAVHPACLAATRAPLVQKLRRMLPHGADIADKQLTFWALVKGQASPGDHLLDVDGVEIVEVGVY